jgi:hypothetical protein
MHQKQAKQAPAPISDGRPCCCFKLNVSKKIKCFKQNDGPALALAGI